MDRARRWLDRPRQQRSQRGLAGAGASDEGDGAARRDLQVDVPQREGALGIGELQATHGHVERAIRHRQAADRFRCGLQHGAQAHESTEARLQIGQVAADLVELTDKGGGDQEQRHQGRRGQPAVRDQGHAREGRRREQPVQQQARPAADLACGLAARRNSRVHHGRQLGAAPEQVGLPEAGPHVVARGNPLLHGCGVVGPGHFLRELSPGDLGGQWAHDQHHSKTDDGEQQPGRPPGRARDHPHGSGAQQCPDEVPHHLTEQGPKLVGVVVDPVEYLADGLLGQHTQRLVQCGGEQVRAQPTLGSVHHPGPRRPAGRVEHRGADHAQR
jgi:hypothetical protein